MKVKIAFWVLGIAAMLASCSNEDVLQETNDSEKNVTTITATLDKNMNSRAADDQSDVYMVSLTVTTEPDGMGAMIYYDEILKGEDGKFTFSIPNLNSGQKYSFVFFAYNTAQEFYNIASLKNVFVKELPCKREAYALATNLTPEEISQSGVQLKHAVAKISMQTTVDLTADDVIRLHATAYKHFNIFTNTARTDQEKRDVFVEARNNFKAGDIIGSIYLLGTEEPQTVQIEYVGRSSKKKITNVPVNPNKHVILKGNFKQVGITDANFSVSFDENWESNETKDF